MSAWIWWLCATFLFLIFELLTGTAAALCVAVGCLFGVLGALLGCNLTWQIVIAAIGSIVALILIGPAVRRIYGKHPRSHKNETGMDALIGRTGTVTHDVTNLRDDKGRVRIDGDSWLAYTTSPEQPLRRGSQVVVESYDSIILQVRPHTTEK